MFKSQVGAMSSSSRQECHISPQSQAHRYSLAPFTSPVVPTNSLPCSSLAGKRSHCLHFKTDWGSPNRQHWHADFISTPQGTLCSSPRPHTILCHSIFTSVRLPSLGSQTPWNSNSITLTSLRTSVASRHGENGMINVEGLWTKLYRKRGRLLGVDVMGGANQLQIQSCWKNYWPSKHGIKEIIALN